MSFLKMNLNPLEKKVGDCVIRAIASATGQSWEQTYTELCALGLELKNVPNGKEVYTLYLKRLGWQKMKMPKVPYGDTYTRLKVREFAEINNKGRYVIDIANHLTAVEDGTIIDIWDCGRKSIGNWWAKETELKKIKNLF